MVAEPGLREEVRGHCCGLEVWHEAGLWWQHVCVLTLRRPQLLPAARHSFTATDVASHTFCSLLLRNANAAVSFPPGGNDVFQPVGTAALPTA